MTFYCESMSSLDNPQQSLKGLKLPVAFKVLATEGDRGAWLVVLRDSVLPVICPAATVPAVTVTAFCKQGHRNYSLLAGIGLNSRLHRDSQSTSKY